MVPGMRSAASAVATSGSLKYVLEVSVGRADLARIGTKDPLQAAKGPC